VILPAILIIHGGREERGLLSIFLIGKSFEPFT
jgi:hypothetical protein